MKNRFLIYTFTILLLGACNSKMEVNNEHQTNKISSLGDWQLEQKVTKKIDSLEFVFPAEGYAFEKRDSLLEEFLLAIEKNLELTQEKDFSTPYRIEFFRSKAAMKREKRISFSGYCDFWKKELNFAATKNPEIVAKENIIPPPIVHESMHMVAMEKWGMPANNNVNWLNEGLATLAANSCNGKTVAEIYSYLHREKLLVPMDSLTTNFFRQDEMIGYHQAAYIVQSLIELHGIAKLRQLWQTGFGGFEEIYGMPFSEMESKINTLIEEQFPNGIEIDWESFKNGCK